VERLFGALLGGRTARSKEKGKEELTPYLLCFFWFEYRLCVLWEKLLSFFTGSVDMGLYNVTPNVFYAVLG
jgi:hypothetical protein